MDRAERPSGRGRSLSRTALAGLLTLTAGLLTRPAARVLPPAWTSSAGDLLWALFVYLLLAGSFPRASPSRIFVATCLFSTAIECGQLFHPAWLDGLRRTTLGGLILGYGFAWSDLACYGTGALAGFGLDRVALLRAAERSLSRWR